MADYSTSKLMVRHACDPRTTPQRREEAVKKCARHEEDRSQESECIRIDPMVE